MSGASPNRWRAPLSVAAAVAVVVTSVVFLLPGDPGGGGPVGTQPTTAPVELPTPARLSPNDPLVTAALDRCATVVDAHPRANEFPPRTAWEPTFGADVAGLLVVPFREYGGKSGACASTATTATVSDPSVVTMELGADQTAAYQYYATLYLPESGVLAGFAQHIQLLRVTVTTPGGVRTTEAVLGNDTFVVNVGTLATGDKVTSEITHPGGIQTAEFVFDAKDVQSAGVTG